ncbi:MAG: hypothetical protein ACK5LN_00365 [Propioniciclava sp.]
MKSRTTVSLALAASALTIGGVAAATLAQAEPSTTPSPSTSSPATPADSPEPDRGHHRGDRGQRLAGGLAEKLGLEETAVAEALRNAHEARPAKTPGASDAERTAALDTYLETVAAELGIPTDDLRAAWDELRSQDSADRLASLTTRLDQAVSDGTLTQAEADAVQKAAEAGIIGYGGGRHR